LLEARLAKVRQRKTVLAVPDLDFDVTSAEGILLVFDNDICCHFSALTLLVGQQEGHPACKKLSGGVLAWLSVWSKMQTCIWPS